MQAFSYHRAADANTAIALATQQGARFIGGGTNLLDLMKGGIESATKLIDINQIGLDDVAERDGGLVIGALVRNSDLANHPLVRTRYPLLSQALLAGASAQLRNMATVGGNLMQRTRCYYFNDVACRMCNKRIPGSGCAAIGGHNRIHAIFGASDSCVATNPSDMNVALAALDATVIVRGAHGERRIAIADFHRLPGSSPQRDTVLDEGELITAVELPASPFADHAHYLKVRDRASYAFALVSVAAALDLSNGTVRDARIVLGGVAHKPWRLTQVEQALMGKVLSPAAVRTAAGSAAQGAHPLTHNRFKLALAQRSVVRALEIAGAQT
jgi:xanthine dehydrogenase YagS FAD-binding subunit